MTAEKITSHKWRQKKKKKKSSNSYVLKPDNLLSLPLHPALTPCNTWGQLCALLLKRVQQEAPGKCGKAAVTVGNKTKLKDKYRSS